jgi:hypothetical protein
MTDEATSKVTTLLLAAQAGPRRGRPIPAEWDPKLSRLTALARSLDMKVSQLMAALLQEDLPARRPGPGEGEVKSTHVTRRDFYIALFVIWLYITLVIGMLVRIEWRWSTVILWGHRFS